MQRVGQHRIDRHDPRWAAIDKAAFASKSLYNAALYRTRQAYLHERRVLPYPSLVKELAQTPEYRALPAKVAQWTLKELCSLDIMRKVVPTALTAERIEALVVAPVRLTIFAQPRRPSCLAS